MKPEIVEFLSKEDLSDCGVSDSGITIRMDIIKKMIDPDILEILGGEIDSFELSALALLAQLVRNTKDKQ